MTIAPDRKYRVLFLCTGNSARSQMAEALLNWKGKGRFEAESAGSRPAARVNPYAIRELEDRRVPWAGRTPQGLDAVHRKRWDFIITVCDKAKEACPVFPGKPILAHWGMPDPAAVEGSEALKQAAFQDAFLILSRRIDLLINLPNVQLDSMAAEMKLGEIGEETSPELKLHRG